ncbi:AraC family transcriptional regulator [Sedimentibacter sp.]|uniref:helix-turn-helix domain-containing protein n=1 Tax=Sedimentibacter sp. TaxID=1960295 RepID=UPI0028AA9F4E|nr:AraC family transcriptional regulator [Sedimentibacter sp.]
MKENINEIINYFAKANISFLDLLKFTVLPHRSCKGAITDPSSGGLIIPISGSACFTLEGEPYIMKPGMVIHAGPDMCLDKEVIGDESWKYAVIHYKIPKSEIKKFPLYQSHFALLTGQNGKISDLLQQLMLSQSTPGASALFRTKLLFTTLLSEIFDSVKKQLADNDTVVIEQVMEHMRKNYAESITIAQIAMDFNMDRRRLFYLFEHQIGITPSNYLIQYRMLKAKELLGTCDCPIKQVAECVGYTDSLYFSRAFKKRTGMAPSEFRMFIKNSV